MPRPAPLNLLFSTTRQWNPGDEIILFGTMAIFDALGVRYNPVIYNRNPDLRPVRQDLHLFRTRRLPRDLHIGKPLAALEANLRYGFFDNSVKPDTDCRFADWAVFAGSPEWSTLRMVDFYQHVLHNDLPTVVLGVGGGARPDHPGMMEVLRKAKLLTVRDPETFREAVALGLAPIELPCPALLSAPVPQERAVAGVERIALVYQPCSCATVTWNGLTEKAHAYMVDLFRRVIAMFGGRHRIEFVVHYIDDLEAVYRLFPDANVRYSFDSRDYFDIYRDYDLVVGPRVHGIGTSASLGVPGVALVHDARGSTCKGFLAETVSVGEEPVSALGKLRDAIEQAPARSQALRAHKRATLDAYTALLGDALKDSTVHYRADAIPAKPEQSIASEILEALKSCSADAGPCRADALSAEIRDIARGVLLADLKARCFPAGSARERLALPALRAIRRAFTHH